MPKIIVSDLDDTLAPEMGFVRSGQRSCSNYLAGKTAEDADSIYAELGALFAESPKHVFNRLLERRNIQNETLLKELIDTYRYHTPQINLYPDVEAFIAKCNALSIPKAIVTDGDYRTQQNKVRALGLDTCFEKIVCTGQFGPSYTKPSIKPFEMIRDFFNAKFEDMVYIGDNPAKDFFMTTQIPITTFRIIRPDSIYRDTPYKSNVREHHQINSISEVLEYI